MQKGFTMLAKSLVICAFAAIYCHDVSAYCHVNDAEQRLHCPKVGAAKGIEIKGSLDASSVLKALFGNYDNAKRMASWPNTPSYRDYFDYGWPEYSTILLSLSTYNSGNKQCALALLATDQVTDMHPAAPYLGYATFQRKDRNTWVLVNDDPYIGAFGEWGKLANYKHVTLGAGIPGVVFLPLFSGQGSETFTFALLGVLDGAFKVLIIEEDYQVNNAGACGDDVMCWGYKGKYCFKASAKARLFDLIITRRGTQQLQSGIITKMQNVKHWAFTNGKYIQDK
jgi:hypothetical protein